MYDGHKQTVPENFCKDTSKKKSYWVSILLEQRAQSFLPILNFEWKNYLHWLTFFIFLKCTSLTLDGIGKLT